jgi:cell division protein ZapA
MAEVNLTIDGRTYGVACDDGQERRVQQLGQYVDQRLREIANGSGANSKAQLMVLTSLLLADEVFDLRNNMTQIANENQHLQRNAPEAPAPQQVVYAGLTPEDEKGITNAISSLAARVDQLTKRVKKAS